MHERIAEVLGWTVAETRSLSLRALRDLVTPFDSGLAEEITRLVASGEHIRSGVVATDMSWLGEPPPVK